MNPDHPPAEQAGPSSTSTSTPASTNDQTKAHTRPFRFKESSSKRPRNKYSEDKHREPHTRHHRKRTSHSRPHTRDSHSKRRRTSKGDSPIPDIPPLSTNDAFRESLFDALGDDEGAQYWEHVYGQPIHNYRVPEVQGPNGELEQMTEEEYVTYVRARMWERTREGMLEAQAKLRAERMQKRKEEEARRRGDERRAFERAMDDSLRRGRERKDKKKDKGWGEGLGGVVGGEGAEGSVKLLRSLLFWPVFSGKRGDVQPGAVEEFMRNAPEEFLATLKSERVRWHPDKIQQRFGSLGIDEVVMRSVTEVFQIVDRLWNEERERK
ncbi:uncharacterized protein N7515_007717 [Penicillium bovifimosum]|uniref:Uncharacterized protein n=1 Tax=Penicillium bovifimosum TaxID=126998 RepID=A0A9W9GM05_9EURO|nr:uncharacterized protein N7515_007717 [Penicillium bovifimosum]KAJ5123892.1 hypothetical protein N7515_007717 [Penicillium bovifimosum]